MYNIICLKYGTKYSSQYVNVLHNMVRRFCSLSFRFVCFTDDIVGIDPFIETKPLLCQDPEVSGWWHKLSFFQEQVSDLTGSTLFLDLDLAIINSIDEFFEYPVEFGAIWDWLHGPTAGVFNSSVIKWRIGEHAHIWNKFQSNPGQIISKYPSDQEFISAESPSLQAWPEPWCISYKWNRGWENINPENRIVVFHGKPNPPEAISGYGDYPPAPWIANFWR